MVILTHERHYSSIHLPVERTLPVNWINNQQDSEPEKSGQAHHGCSCLYLHLSSHMVQAGISPAQQNSS